MGFLNSEEEIDDVVFLILCLDEDDKELQKYSKNYLPILFNLYLSESENGNDKIALPILETMKAYVKITDQTVDHN